MLIPTDQGYLEAELAGDRAGVLKLPKESPGARDAGAKSKSGCGGPIPTTSYASVGLYRSTDIID